MGSTSTPEGRNSFLAQGLICLLRHKSCWRRLPCWAQRCLPGPCVQAAAVFLVCQQQQRKYPAFPRFRAALSFSLLPLSKGCSRQTLYPAS